MPDCFDSRKFRSALGRFASGVTVITTLGRDARPHGMTANGFVSVSLEPPLVLVSVGHRSHTHSLLSTNGRYAVSVLRDDQLEVAQHFAGKTADSAFDFAVHDGMPVVPGALAHLACDIEHRVPAGDHTLHIGRVRSLESHAGDPLLFYSGEFSTLAS